MPLVPEIDYSKYQTEDEVAQELEEHKSKLHRLVKLVEQTTEEKKAMAAGFRDTLKELKEQIAYEVAAIDGFSAHRKALGYNGK